MSVYKIIQILLVFTAVVDNAGTQDLSPFGDIFEAVGVQKLTTNKKYLFVGEQLTVRCDLSKEDVNNNTESNQLSFQRISVNGSPTSRVAPNSFCFDEANVFYPNKDSAVLNITATPEMAGVYRCYERPGCHGEFIGVSHDISVEYAPRNVTDFECVVLNWGDEMQCSWRDPLTYVNSNDTRVDLKYKSSFQQDFSPCPKSSPDKCIWNPFAFSNHYIMIVTVTNVKRNVSVKKAFNINANHIVKPSPAEELVVTNDPLKPGCLHLTWTHSKKNWSKIYRVQVKEISSHSKHDEDFKVLGKNVTSMIYDVCGFPAYSHLNVSVEVCPGGDRYSGYSSEPRYCSGWTPQEAPSSGPVIAKGSFAVNTSSETKEYGITFYWIQVDESERNGIIDSYLLKPQDGPEKTVASQSSLSAVISHNKRTPFTVSIYAHNKGGMSQHPSTWHINPRTMKVPEDYQNSFVAKIVNEDLILYWNNTSKDIYSVTVYWCYGSSPIGKCEVGHPSILL